MGDVDTGKGVTVFAICTNILAEGGFVIDTFGSDTDSETLSWFKSPYKDRTAAIVSDEWKGVIPFNCLKVSDFSVARAKEFDVVVTDKVFFRDEVDHYASLGRIFKVCSARRGYKQEPGKPIMALAVREARKVIRSQITANMSKDEQAAQWAFVDLNAQRAHSGITPVVDSQRWMDVHVTYRDLASYKVLKGFGPQVSPDELDWVWHPRFKSKWMRSPYRTRQFWESFLRSMPVDMFVSLDRANGVCFGAIGDISWVKFKGYDLARMLGIEPDFEAAKPKTLPAKDQPGGKKFQTIALHRRVRELAGQGMTDIQIIAQIEKETGIKRTKGFPAYHRIGGGCNCEEYSGNSA